MFTRIILIFCVLICLYFNSSFAIPKIDFDQRIMGGSTTEITKIPYIVSLQYLDPPTFACGGSILTRNIVLTAAHCTSMSKLFNDTIRATAKIRAGSEYAGSGGILIPVQKIINPSYGWDHDISVLVLSKNLIYSSKIKPIALARTQRSAGTMASVSGWGFLSSYLRETVEELRSVSVPIVDWNECKKTNWFIKRNQICAGYMEGGFDSCQGDSGGPLVEGNELIGVVGEGVGCGLVGKPGIYTDIVSERQWILNITSEYSVDNLN